ncbi:unnamed protein product [Effrenium voratum]|nr:unnamed protein product [Effrenium voratum]
MRQAQDWTVRAVQREPEQEAMDASSRRLTEKAWELRLTGDGWKDRDPSQAVRHYEWALDILRPVPVEHAGPSRCALLLKLARCHLAGAEADPARALRCCDEVKENDRHRAWQAEVKAVRQEASAILGSAPSIGTLPAKRDPGPGGAATAKATAPARLASGRSGGMYCLELNAVQTFNMLDSTLTDDLFFALDAIKEDRLRRG